jgi:hypothetical protein
MFKKCLLSSINTSQHEMRRITRINESIAFLQRRLPASARSPYLCVACRTSAAFSTSSFRRDAEASTTDRIRRKLWKTQNPPGSDNPYGDGVLAEHKYKRAGTERVEESTNTEFVPKTSRTKSFYQPAETWHGLEEVGGFEPEDFEHPFHSFAPAETVTRDEHVKYALHRAMVEVFAAQQAGKPLSIVSQMAPNDNRTEDGQITPSETGVELHFTGAVSLHQIVQSLCQGSDEANEIGSPTESEEGVTADRSRVNPLRSDDTPVVFDETATKEAPTESEEDVAADKSAVDPLKDAEPKPLASIIASWDPSWLQISLANPEVKFAVS